MVFVVLCLGIPEGSTGSGSVYTGCADRGITLNILSSVFNVQSILNV